MKKNLADIFDEAGVKELDVIFDGKENISDELDGEVLERIKAEVLVKTNLSEMNTGKKKTIIRHWKTIAVMAAAGFILLISAGFGSYVYATELKEYKAAVSFFNDYGLSTEGLSRVEIKEVYRDITTESFAYSKTAQVIAKSISNGKVEGHEILQSGMLPEDVEDLWNYRNYNRSCMSTGTYKFYSDYKKDEELGFDVQDKSCLEKYDGDSFLWQVSFEEFCIDGYTEVRDGVIIFGYTPTWSSEQTTYSWLSKVDDKGNILWKQKMDNGFEDEYIADVIENNDGTYAVFSRGDYKYFCLSRYNTAGKLKSFNKTEVGNYGIWDVARFKDGYIVQLGNYTLADGMKIVKADSEGNIIERFSYTGKDCFYYITDMIEFDGKIYLSAYAVPKNGEEGENDGGSRYEIDGILKYIFESGRVDIPSEELTPVVRGNYMAILLVCEPDKGIPEEFYSVGGSLGGRLSLDESGRLLWDVESITTTFFSPATSSFTIGGTSYVFRYTFDNDGTLVSQEKTGETAVYRR